MLLGELLGSSNEGEMLTVDSNMDGVEILMTTVVLDVNQAVL